MMKRILLATCLLVVGVCSPAPADDLLGAKAAVPPPDSSSGTRLARVGNLIWNGTLPANTPLLESGIAEAAWQLEAGKLAMKELGLSEQAAREALKVSAPAGTGEVRLTLTLPSDTQAARDAGARFLGAVAMQVATVALPAWVDSNNQLPVRRAEDALEGARKEFDTARAVVADQRRKIRDAADVLDPSSEAVRGAMSRLEQERQRTELELVGQNARQRALQERVAQLADKAAAKASDDPIAAEIEKIVKIREAEAAQYTELSKEGVSAGTLRTAEAHVAEARAKLLERREVAAHAAGIDLLTDLNKELITVSISIAENEARVAHVSNRLKGLARATDLVDDLDQSQATVARSGKQLERAEAQLQEVRRQAATAPALSVTIHWNDPVLEPMGRAQQGKGTSK